MLAGFVLIPQLGTSASIIVMGLVLAVPGGALAAGSVRHRKMLRPAVGLAAAAALVAVFFVPAARLTYVQRYVHRHVKGVPAAHYEDTVASVDVTGATASKPHSRNLFINGVGITQLTIITQELAYLPKATRPSAATMLNICFGMGSTFRSSIIAGLRTTAVDLDPTVPTVMPWFHPDASAYLHSPLGNVVISDGRNYVRLSDKRYDLITIDSPPPIWSAGAVVLLTREFYQEASQRLTPGGVLTTYLPLQSPQREKLILRTFRSVFPYMSVVYTPRPAGVFILGSQAPIAFSPAAIQTVFGSPAAGADLRGAPDYPAHSAAQWVSVIHDSVWLTGNQVNSYTGAGPLLTDDHPLTEYYMLGELGDHTFHVRTLDLRLFLAVTGLLALLIIGAVADSVARRRSQPAA
jgi:spermidine synthase